MTYLKTGTETEAVRALEFVAHHAARAADDTYEWKWVVIGLHNALQPFMVLALAHGAGLEVLRDKIAKRWLAAYRSGGPYPKEELDPFLNLFAKIQGKEMRLYVNSRPLVATAPQKRSIKKLNDLRNRFIHFLPDTWLIELGGLRKIALDCIRVAEFLTWKSGNVTWVVVQPSQARRAFRAARKSLAALVAA